MLNRITIQKGKIGTDVNSNKSATSAIIIGADALPNVALEASTPVLLYSMDDAKTLGITSEFDMSNKVLLHYHVSEFYRMAGAGTPLYLQIVPQDLKPSALFADGGLAQKLATSAKGEIRQLAIAYNMPNDTEDTLLDGLNADIRAALAPAQAFAEYCYQSGKPLQILLEGRYLSATPNTAINLRQLEVSAGVILEADKVSIIIGQDYDFANSLWESGKYHAAVGTVLGTLAFIDINRNIGEVAVLNLSNAAKGSFVKAGLSSHVSIEDAENYLPALDTKGYIFPILYTGISGFRWNDDHVCTPIIVDAEGNMNESNIAYGRTIDEAVRRLYQVYTPLLKSVQTVDAETGKLPLGTIKYLEQLGDDVFNRMSGQTLISGGKTYIDRNSDLLTGDKSLGISFELVPTGTIGKISGKINLKTSL